MSRDAAYRSLSRLTALACAVAALLLLPAVATAAGDTFDGGQPFTSPAAAKLMNPAAAVAGEGLPNGFTESIVWDNLVAPTAFRFAPDGRVFVALKSGIIDVFDGINDPTPTIYADLRTQVADFWDRGLLGLAIDPKFDEGRPYIYALYTYNKDPNSTSFPRWPDDSCPTPPGANGDGCVVTGRLSRISPDGSEKVLIEDWCQQYPTHSIGTVQFGPDGALYVGSGDGASYTFADYGQDGAPVNPCGDPPGTAGSVLTPPTAQGGALRSQSFRRETGRPVALNGSILRVDPDTGAAMSDNPNANDPNANRRRIVAYGFRNPYRFVFRPGTSEIWAGDVGWDTWEEIDRIEDPLAPTKNYGWPCYEGDGVMGAYHALGVNLCESLYADGENAVVDPYFVYQHGTSIVDGDGCGRYSSSITGISFYTGGNFPAAYQNALFFTDYARGCIWWMPAGDDGLPDASDVRVFQTGSAGPVYLAQGPDGALWYADLEGGTIRRIAYPGGNGAPNALATADRVSGPTPLTVDFDGTESSDSDGGSISYSWDLDGDGVFGDSTDSSPTYTYTHPGRYLAKLRVTDDGGLTDTMSVTITAGDPPTAQITSPDPTLTWAVGDQIMFSGAAVDSAGHPIPASGLSWQLNIRHCSRFQEGSCHTHIAQNIAGVSSGSFVAPDHDWPSHLELVLTAIDADGLMTTKSVDIYPQTVDMTFTSSPVGAQLNYGYYAITTPATMTVIKGSQSTLTAATPQTVDGRDYDFAAWTDGGSRTRTIVANAPTTYNAILVPSTSTTLAGANTVGTNVSSAPPGAAEAYKITGSTSGSASKLRVFVDESNEASELTVGLYSDDFGEPGALLGTGSTSSIENGAWNDVPLPESVDIEAGGTYWLSVMNPLTSTGPLAWRDRAVDGGGPERTSLNRTMTELPALWATLGSWNDGPISGYVLGAKDAPIPPNLGVSPTALTFGATEGAASPPGHVLSVTNGGGGTLQFTASSNRPWLSVTPASGTAPRDVTVSVDTTGLTAGTYTGAVTVDAGSTAGSPKTVPITVTVAPAAIPVLSATPTTLSFNAVSGGTNPASKPISVTNTGSGTLSFTASDNASWLTVTPSNGSAPATLTAAVDLTGLAAGTYNATITIDAGAISGSPSVIPVTLIVSTQPPPGTDTLGGAAVVGTNTSSAPPGSGEAYRITNAVAGAVTRVRLYVDGSSTATQLVLGVYSDLGGAPSALLSSASVTTVAKGAWNEVTLPSPIQVTAGTPYWIGLLNPAASGGTLAWRDRAGTVGGAEATSFNRNLTTLPTTWLTLGSWTDGPVSGYLLGTAGGVVPPPAELVVSASTLDFTATRGAANPATKSFVVSNAGGGSLNYTLSDDAAWLSATPASGSAPQTVTVAADTTGLAAGIYTGHVTVTAGGANGSPKTVTVTLTVAETPAVLDVSTSALSFSAVADGADPDTQTLSVANLGGGALNFTAASDATWLTATPSSGTAPKTLTVSAKPAGLTAGTKTGHLTIDAGAAGTRTVTVTFTVAEPPPVLALSKSSLTFSGVQGGAAPASQTVSISNTGGGTLNFTADGDAPWLSVTPDAGTAPNTMTVSVDPAGLSAGTYTGLAAVDSGPAGHKTVAITFVVADQPAALAVSADALSFSAIQGGANPSGQALTVSNTGGGTLSFTAQSDKRWLSVTPASGSAPTDLTISVDATGLTAGDRTAHLTVDAGAAGTKTIAVSFTVAEPPPALELSTDTLSFSATEGGSNPAAQTVSVTNTGGGALSYTAESDAGWLSITPGSGSAGDDLTVAVDLAGLRAGTHTATVTVDGGDAGVRTITVTLALAEAPAVLSVSTQALSFSGTQGESNPAAKSVSVSNTGAGSLSFTTSSDSAWLAVSPTTGSAPKDLSVSVDLAGLSPGTTTGHVTVDAGAAGTKTVTVTLVVAEPPAVLALSTQTWSFSAMEGDANPAGKIVTITNTGGGSLNFTAGSDAAWLTVSPSSGTAPKDLTIGANLTGLAANTYTGHVTVDAGAAGTQTVTVTLVVIARPVLSASPSALTFSVQEGGAAPAAQSVSVSHTGGGALAFTTASNTAWLSATPAGGTSPGNVTVSASPTGLAAGTYTGQLTISAAGANGSPKTIAVTLNVIADPNRGLVGAWGFDETTGTTAADASGKGNVGTISGATRTTSGKAGGALTFNGRNSWVTVTNSSSLALTTGMTLEGWAYPTAGAGGGMWRAMFVKETASSLAWALYPFGDGGLPSGHAFTSKEVWASGTSAPPLNAWTHVAATYDGTTVRFYANGVLTGSKAQTGSLTTSTQPLRIGGDAIWSEWFDGRLDELRVYNRALSATEIQADMTRPVSSTAVLAAHRRTTLAKRGSARIRTKRVGKPVRIKHYRGKRPHGRRRA